MFKLNANPTFWATVKVTRPGEEPVAIDFEFRHKTRSGLADWQKTFSGNVPAPTQDDPDAVVKRLRPDREIIDEYITNWRNVIDDKGGQVPWSVDAFLVLLENFPAAVMEVYVGYVDALTGSRTKN